MLFIKKVKKEVFKLIFSFNYNKFIFQLSYQCIVFKLFLSFSCIYMYVNVSILIEYSSFYELGHRIKCNLKTIETLILKCLQLK